MGMYDSICGEQVKCFYDYYWCHDLFVTGGFLISYDVGDEVPWNRGFYNYTENFNILIEDCENLEWDNAIVGIRNEKIVFIKDLLDTENTDYVDRCIDYYGKDLAVFNKEDVLDYLKNKKSYEEERLLWIKTKMPIQKKWDLLAKKVGDNVRKNQLDQNVSLQKEMNELRELMMKEWEMFDKNDSRIQDFYLKKYRPEKTEEQKKKERDFAYQSCLRYLRKLAEKGKEEDKKNWKECEEAYQKFLEEV